MEIITRSRLLGTARRTEILIAIALLEETYARELSRLLGAPLWGVQRVVDALEREGVIAVRTIGRQRMMSLSPRYFARRELDALLRRLAEGDVRLRDAVADLRRSPRKKGKTL